jgi:hypothetical protein
MHPEPRTTLNPAQHLLIALPLLCACASNGQGVFTFYNPAAPTLLHNGGIAGPGIWGQALVGVASNSLSPVGLPAQHQANGILQPQLVSVTTAPFYTYVQVQMAVWDGAIWGPDFASVPANQLGFTDIVPVFLVLPADPTYDHPHFMRPAVVPLVPEPSVGVLAFAGVAAFYWRTSIGRARISRSD